MKLVPNTVLITKLGKALTIDELIRRYALSNEADGKSPKTIVGYSCILFQFISHLNTQKLPLNISSFNIQIVRDYMLYLRNKHKYEGHPYIITQSNFLSPETIKCHTRSLKAFSTWLYSEGYTSENVLMHLKLPRVPMKIIEPLTPEEIWAVCDSIDKKTSTGYRDYVIFNTALDNGSRASELTGITLGKLDLQRGYIKVMGKGSKERIVPIGKFVTGKIWHYIDQIRPKPIDPGCDRLFLSSDGKPITVNTIKLIFSRLAKKSGVVRLHAHLCRHTFAINYLLNGGDIFSLKEILGHATLDMVNHYLHFTNAQITERHHQYSPMDHLQNVTK
jgi:site-specific recombinase XerD